MADKIIYTLVDNGMDGRAPSQVVFASYDKEARDQFALHTPNKNYLRKDKQLLDVEVEIKAALQRLGAIGRLVLGV